MIFALLLTMGLDMSLPEFEPTVDVSGDYIVGSYDVSANEFVVEKISEVDLSPSPELFTADSESSVVLVYLEPSFLSGYGVDTSSEPYTILSGSNTYRVFSLSAGVTYYITRSSNRLFLSDSFAIGNTFTSLYDTIYTPSSDCVVFFNSTYSFSVGYYPSGNDPSGNDRPKKSKSN